VRNVAPSVGAATWALACDPSDGAVLPGNW